MIPQEKQSQLLNIGIKKRNKEITDSWNTLALNHGGGYFDDGEKYRCWVKNQLRKDNDKNSKYPSTDLSDSKIKYKEETRINKDGSYYSDKLLEMSEEQEKSPEYLLQAHGFDINKWELVSARNNFWNTYSKQDGVQQLYSSKITTKPIKDGFDFDRLLEIVTKEPTYQYRSNFNPNLNGEYLLLPLYDMHWGINTFDYYKEVQDKLMYRLDNKYKEILLIFGQDMFHNDSIFNGRTAKGTEIDKVDMVQAWEDVIKFFVPLIKKAISIGSKMKIVYSKGNHSETMEWAFVQYLKGVFPDAEFDDSLKERKAHMLGLNFIGANHGDKKNENKLPENFATEFPMEWSRATTRTVFTGHRHIERVVDVGGILVRRMPTKNQIDDWHNMKGYTTGHKRFQIHEFNESEQTGIFYL